MRVALVHDYLKEYGGAERVLEALCELFPDAPIYTAFYVKDSSAGKAFANKKIIASGFNKILQFKNLFSPLRFLTPLIWESFNFDGFDLVISSASWYITKSIITNPSTVHICYCHTPPRWLYGFKTALEWKRFWPVRIYGEILGHFLRQYDYLASKRVDYFIANSKNTQERIKKFYRRDSDVIYPPVNVEQIIKETANLKPKNYYLVVARLAGAKGLDLAIDTARKLGITLKIVGEPVGLKWENHKIPGINANIEFLGRVNDQDLWKLYGECKAFLALAQDEDFGITPVEAMAAGRPVIAFRGGGYLETVVEGKTGVFFSDPTAESLSDVISKLYKLEIREEDCREQARNFSQEKFRKNILEFVKEKTEENARTS